MRHTLLSILFSVILAMISVDVEAQIVFTPFIPQQYSSIDIGGFGSASGTSRSSSGYSRPSCQTELARTTAYFVDYVVSCQSITANGPSAYLESSFMYKAMVGTQWYYFDL